MEKLYYKDRYLKQCNSKVVKILVDEEYTSIKCSEDIFFPGGGGQKSDKGEVRFNDNIFEVLGYKKIENEDYLILDKNAHNILKLNDEVLLTIDWSHREDHMHQHSAQHILSGCFFTMFGNNTLGLHIGEEFSQLDIEGQYTKDDIIKIEDFANKVISDSIEMENYPIDDIERTNTRRALPNTDDEIRVLKIGNLDLNACCGVHAKNTRDIRLIKIKKFYKHKNGTRIEYLAGNRAIEYLLERDNIFERILNKFNCGDSNIENAISNLEEKNVELYELNKSFLDKHVNNEINELITTAKTINSGIKFVLKEYKNEKEVLIEELVRKISSIDECLALIINDRIDKVDIRISVSKETSKKFGLKLGKDFKDICNKLDIKGGGSDSRVSAFSQNKKDIDIFVEKFYSIYIEKFSN